jgi:hypothetical protein
VIEPDQDSGEARLAQGDIYIHIRAVGYCTNPAGSTQRRTRISMGPQEDQSTQGR